MQHIFISFYFIKYPTWCNFIAVVFIIHCQVNVRVSGAVCTHHQEYVKTVGAIAGASHVSVWCKFKSVKRCPRSRIYFTMSWPNFVTRYVFTPQAGGPPPVGYPRLLIQYISGYPPRRRPLLHPQPEDAPCPFITRCTYRYSNLSQITRCVIILRVL